MSQPGKTSHLWRWALAMLLLVLPLTIFYAFTALVFDEGYFGFDLVLKPEPGWGWYFGGGERGTWARLHPNEPQPWWLSRDFTVLIHGDWEFGSPWWRAAYAWGLLATFAAWIILLGIGSVTIARGLIPKRRVLAPRF